LIAALATLLTLATGPSSLAYEPEVGGAVETRVDDSDGVSLAARLRMGALDSFLFPTTYGYGFRNRHTRSRRLAFANVVGGLQVPLRSGLHLSLDAGFSFETWIHAVVELKYRIVGNGGPGTWVVSVGSGIPWVLPGFVHGRNDPRRERGGWEVGPTITIGLEHRF
jgi:hypothetical protein